VENTKKREKILKGVSGCRLQVTGCRFRVVTVFTWQLRLMDRLTNWQLETGNWQQQE